MSRALFVPFVFGLIPVPIMYVLQQKNMIKGRMARAVVDLMLCSLGLGIGLGAGVALFPQQGAIDVRSMAPRFQGLVDSRGRKIENFTFNKGI